MEGLTSEYHKTLDMLASIDAPVKLIIAGNHDRTLDKTWMKNHEKLLMGMKWEEAYEEAKEMWVGEEGRARKEGVRMLEEGVHEVEVGNGAVLKVSGFLLFLLSLLSPRFVLLKKHIMLQQAKGYNNQHVKEKHNSEHQQLTPPISSTHPPTNPSSTTGPSPTKNTRTATTLPLKPCPTPKTSP